MEQKLGVRPATNDKFSERLLFFSLCSLFFFLPIGTSPATISGILVIAVWLFTGKFIRDWQKWLKQPWTMPVVIFMLLPWVGLLWTEDIPEGLKWATKGYYWFLAFAVATSAGSREDRILFLKYFLAGQIIVAAISVLQVIGIIPLAGNIPSVLEGNRITGPLLLVFSLLVLSFVLLQLDTIKQRFLAAVIMALFFFALASAGGRAGYLAFLLVLPLIIYNLMGKRRIWLMALVVVLIIGAMSLFSPVRDRLSAVAHNIEAYQQQNPNTAVGLRLHMWSGAVKMILADPFFGQGTGGYRKAMQEYINPGLAPEFRDFAEPHNSFLYMAANFGLVGLFALGWLLWEFLKKGWRYQKSIEGFAVLSYGLILIIGSLTATQILYFETANLFALFVGLPMEPKEV